MDRTRARAPEVLSDGLQIAKSTVAATLAWWLSVSVLDSELPFLAPWTALLTVHATVYRSLRRGAQTTVASVLGVALSFVIGQFLGVNIWSFALALLVGLVGSRLIWLREEGVAIATTALFVLGSGFEGQAPLLDDRLVEVGMGVLVGVAVNLAVIPPLRNRQAAYHADNLNRHMGAMMVRIADDMGGAWDVDRADTWLEEINFLDLELESAWRTVRFARESARMNPRRNGAWRVRRARRGNVAPVGFEEILARLGEGISHLRHLTRTLRDATMEERGWDQDFRRRWVAIVRDAGRAIQDPDAEVAPTHERLDELAQHVAVHHDGPGNLWPIYGSLITSMRHIAVIVDDVASAREAREAD